MNQGHYLICVDENRIDSSRTFQAQGVALGGDGQATALPRDMILGLQLKVLKMKRLIIYTKLVYIIEYEPKDSWKLTNL